MMSSTSLLATSFGDGDVLLWFVEFFLFMVWFWLLIVIFGDLFRDQDLSGGMKALWVLFVVIVPFIGILCYLLFRGSGMAARQTKAVQEARSQMDAQIRAAAGTSDSAAEQITKAKSLLDSGVIDQTEFDHLKAKALGS
jgi:hypothetical protein